MFKFLSLFAVVFFLATIGRSFIQTYPILAILSIAVGAVWFYLIYRIIDKGDKMAMAMFMFNVGNKMALIGTCFVAFGVMAFI